MLQTLTLPQSPQRRTALAIAALLALVAAVLLARALLAQVDGDRGIPAVVSTQDIEVSGIEVDTTGDTAEEARQEGWKEAQRKAWEKIGGPAIADGQLDSLVSAIVIERERLGPKRYIATLGVVFDRARAGGYLGRGGAAQRSAPMMLLPVIITAGTETIYEIRNPWQRAWAEYQAGASRISYVRPSGANQDSLILTYGQTGRRSRTWWRNLLDQYGAADVLVPIANLSYQYPGGPVEGRFTARYGPDNEYLGSFTMTAPSSQALPEMLGRAVQRFNTIFESALADGKLKPDPTLRLDPAEIDPAIERLLEIGRAAVAREREAARRAAEGDRAPSPSATPEPTATPTATPTPGQPAIVYAYVVQFATPDAGSVDATLAAVRSAPGVRGAATTSLAIGGTSVMSVTFNGSLGELASALRGRGFTVSQGGAALSIRR